MATTKARKAAVAEPAAGAVAPALNSTREPDDEHAEPVGGAIGDNLFEALGLPGADERYLKSLLSELIDDEIEEQKLTQAAAADKMGLSQPDVSAILRGRFKNYSVFRLLKALAALGYDIEIRPAARAGRTPGGVKIVA